MKRIKKFISLLTISLVFLLFLYFQNNAITITEHEVSSSKLPEEFDGFKIVQLSDLHSKEFGKSLPNKVREAGPNIIVFTGDLVDQKNYDELVSLKLMEELVMIAPVYFVTGNHEAWSGKFNSLEEKLVASGVHVLRNSHESIRVKEDEIILIGIDDPAMISGAHSEFSAVETSLEDALHGVADQYKILLSHRPEMFSLYTSFNIDLIFSGHAHGGQIRLPFIDGLVAPNQGFFPKYTAGKHQEAQSTMIINRGLGNSIIPQRLFNRPEIVIVTLRNDEL
ncbi:MAG: metallophosphoesterase [Anaerobacillus sp.]|uniref:metallophosphoesterase n=1 Tax=Anaerobacillus sp. TaxID=1872506 RepID=UPI003918B1E6